MRILAVLASFNESVYVQACIENYLNQGIDVYLIDNSSEDDTVEVAKQYLGKGLIAIESFPRQGVYNWAPILKRKEQIVEEIGPDWAIHADMDEIRSGSGAGESLREAIVDADRRGYDLINCIVYLFVPTIENPDHYHPDFPASLKSYRYMEPSYPNQIKTWKHRPGQNCGLERSGGHRISFGADRLSPIDVLLKHYPVLSLEHARRKYVQKTYSADEIARGWHGWKATVTLEELHLPSENDMDLYIDDRSLLRERPINRNPLYKPID